MTKFAALALVGALTTGCALRGAPAPAPVDPVVIANAVHGALIVAEQAQAIEAALWALEQDSGICILDGTTPGCISRTPSWDHCEVQRAFGTFARVADQSLAVVFDLAYPGVDRARALRALVQGSADVVHLVAPRLTREQQIALRAGLTAGTVAVMTLESRRMPVEAPPEVLQLRVDVEAALRRMALLAAQECPE